VAHAYHDNLTRYFEHQFRVTADYVIPFVEQSGPIPAGVRVLEIGCGEAGVLKAFLERGARAVGVDRNGRRLARGTKLLADALREGRLTLLHQDAAELAAQTEYRGYFDLIVLKDVIEHIDDRPGLFALMAKLLRPGGRIFLSFPPWQMPFGGHQQICKSWLLSHTPYFHLLPMPAYRAVLAALSESPSRIESLVATKQTGISVSDFESAVSRAGYCIKSKRLYLFNPIYALRFGLAARVQSAWISRLESVRDFVTTCAYYTVAPAAELGVVPSQSSSSAHVLRSSSEQTAT